MTPDLTKFAHLHTHTEYSFLDGMIKTKDLVKKTKEQGLEYTAITDHGGLFGAMEFHNACGKDIAPIIGFEAYIISGSRFEKRQEASSGNDVEERGRNHLILLAETQEGWKNLMYLSSIGYTEGFYKKPRIDMDILRERSKGLIGTSACIAGMIPSAFLNRKSDEENFIQAEKILDEYLKIFGENNFFLELQDHGLNEEKTAYPKVIELGKKKGVPFIVANDAHYLDKQDSEAHEVLLALQTQKKLSDPNRYKFSADQFYLKTPEEMAKLFPEIPEAFSNTYEIAKRCGEKIKLKSDPQMPSPGVPKFEFPEEKHKDVIEKINGWIEADKMKDGFWAKKTGENKERTKEFLVALEEAEYLTQIAYEGARQIYGEPLQDGVVERLEYELDTIIKMGFQGYYLIVRDFLKKADELEIFRGVRGSAAGSLVCYCTEISSVDPLRFGLFFERFLNPERISLPDVDSDFAEDRRQDIINYCREKYGKENFCQIINFGTMKAKMAVKDVARTLEIPLNEANELAKMVGEGLKSAEVIESEKERKDKSYERVKKEELFIKHAIEANAELKKKIDENPSYKNLFKYAQKFEGLVRQPGVHAAGVVIAPGDVRNWTPVSKQAGDDKPIVSQFDMDYIEKSGMIKMDILGLRTFTLLKDAIELIKINHKKSIDMWKDIPENDELTYKEIFQKGNTAEIFQFESPGMRKYLKQLKANSLEDLTAMTAMYRPGPMDSIETLIETKHGRRKTSYAHPKLATILDVTYGFIVYQEQVMSIAREIGGFSMGQADELRKAMGKKIKAKMDEMNPKFIEGAKKQNISENTAEAIWAHMEKFASYGFNKAHACVYAHISYYSAYLKAHYPMEYMAAVITSHMGKNEKFAAARNEAQRMGINILPPNINISLKICVIQGKDIVVGFNAVKGVGQKAADNIVLCRNELKRNFENIFDFCANVDLSVVNKKALESLIYSGAFDCCGSARSQNFEAVEEAILYGKKIREEKESNQISIFCETGEKIGVPKLPNVIEWNMDDKLQREKDALGFYASGSPLDKYKYEIDGITTFKLDSEEDGDTENSDSSKVYSSNLMNKNGTIQTVAGIVVSKKELSSKKDGRIFAFITIENIFGTKFEITVWSDKYEIYSNVLNEGNIIAVKGKLKVEIENTRDDDSKEEDDAENDEYKVSVIAEKIIHINEVRKYLKEVHAELSIDSLNEKEIEEMMNCCNEQNGDCSLFFHIVSENDRELKIKSQNIKVNNSNEFLKKLTDLPSVISVRLKQIKTFS
ncbi:MAG: DNA polymerase III subunit alpha [Chitinispirillales bacterium]|jgi:DNA polymerase-3 subunit alpha|nr:DNA polymerase III subunit alpha [Chitinispirillales bacterium]